MWEYTMISPQLQTVKERSVIQQSTEKERIFIYLTHGGGRAEMRKMKTERRRMNQRTWTMLALELEGRRSEQRPSMSFSCCFADHSPPLCIFPSSLFQGPLEINGSQMGQFGEHRTCWIAYLFREKKLWPPIEVREVTYERLTSSLKQLYFYLYIFS